MRFLLPLLLLSTPALALDEPLTCSGSSPDWALAIEGDTATFDFTRLTELNLMLETEAQGAPEIRALTLIGRGDSVIVLLDPTACPNPEATYGARLLTQRGETPLLLVGCCYSER